MKANAIPKSAPRLLQAALAIVFAAGPVSALAAITDLSPAPIASTSSGVVKPNINFILDSSGSMSWAHAPDDAENFANGNKYGYKASQCNSIYYNPTINYVPPKRADGTDFPNSSFTGAWNNGFDPVGDGTRNLNTNFIAYDNTTSSGQGTDTAQAAYYYRYTGVQTFNFLNTTNTFYRECNSTIPSGSPGTAVFNKVIVSGTSGPGSTDERTNFANWYSYYRTRLLLMKSGAGRAFSTIGANYRIGFMTLWATPSASTTDTDYLAINDFDTAQKAAWYTKLYAKDPALGTPLKSALSMAGRNFAGRVGPDPVQYSCQQNFAILTTDGYWNAGNTGTELNGTTVIGQQDGNSTTMPRPMFDGNVSGATGTLADVAAYYYNTDLRTGPTCNTGVAGADVCTNNVPTSTLDTAAHQHMTLFTLGLGVNGQLGFASNYLAGGSADYNAITGGSKDWPKPTGDTLTTIDDLWHAAVNGRGQYFSAKNPDSLVTGLRAALAGVSTREAAGAAAATSNLEPVAGDNFAYVANYRTQKWDGDVEARLIDLATGAISNTATWSAQAGLDSRTTATGDSRIIFTYLAGAKRDFIAANFSAAELTSWFTPGNAPALTQFAGWSVAQKAQATPVSLINYLRGQFGNEGRPANAFQLYRTRDHVLGDIVNGKPVFAKVPPFQYNDVGYSGFKSTLNTRAGMVYAAANDGMLHAFDSTTGAEVWAYIPSFVLPNLKSLADDNYPNAHKFSTDGSPVVADVCITNPCTAGSWRTILVAGLNAGGKGYYALDITNPGTPQVLWEFTHAEMGFTYGLPIISKLKDGTWNVFVTNGYNNPDGLGRLFVLNAYTGALKLTLSTGALSGGTATTPSGLAKISAWVDDGLVNNTVERIYGGDTLGNLWRFDVNNTIAPAGTEASRLALLQTSGGYKQPITTKPELGLVSGYDHPINKYPVIYIGTGKYLGASDVLDLGQQSVYAIRDDLTAAGVGDIRNSPVAACSGANQFIKQSLLVSGASTFTVTDTKVDFEVNCGWYIDFSAAPNPAGERVNVDPKLQLGVLAVATNIPETSICTVGGVSWLYFFDYRGFSGELENPPTVVGQKIGSAIAVGINTYKLPDGRVVSTVTTSDDKHPVFANPDLGLIGSSTKRVLWRELLN